MTILGLPRKIGNANTEPHYESGEVFSISQRMGTGSTCFRLRCPAETSPDEAGLFLADRGHSLTSFLPPPAAVGLATCWGAPAIVLGVQAPSSLADPGHSLRSLHLPPAALPSLPNPNTEVKLICADNTWRATLLLRCPVLSLARTPASLTDRSHSLRSLPLPLAALPSLPIKLSAATLVRVAFYHSNLRLVTQKEGDTKRYLPLSGDPPEIRTPDPLLKRQLLCQLS